MTVDIQTLTELHRGTLAEWLDIRFIEANLDHVVAEISCREALRLWEVACMVAFSWRLLTSWEQQRRC